MGNGIFVANFTVGIERIQRLIKGLHAVLC